MHIHLIGVCGAGMAPLAGILKQAGHQITGSDANFNPPMSTLLSKLDIKTYQGFSAKNLQPRPDLVVVGNVCRSTNPEASAAIESGIPYESMPGVIEKYILNQKNSLVVAGTHGKTSTSSLISWLLEAEGLSPGYLIGGKPANFPDGFRLGKDLFVIEGDEYDSAFFEKKPKFLRYRPQSALITSVEHDHLDIYSNEESYIEAFSEFVSLIPKHGLLVLNAADKNARALGVHANCRCVYYGIEGQDFGEVSPTWSASLAPASPNGHEFDLFIGGSYAGRATSPMVGQHYISNALGAFALLAEQQLASVPSLVASLSRFEGVARRQQLLAISDNTFIYDDFAHHPTAVRETLHALRQKHPDRKLITAFEPRSATACSNYHQAQYVQAFKHSDHTIIAPVGRKGTPEQQLDTNLLSQEINTQHGRAIAATSLTEVEEQLMKVAEPGSIIVLMSNGQFGGIHDRIIARLATRTYGKSLDI